MKEKMITEQSVGNVCPLVPLRSTVAHPNVIVEFEVGRVPSRKAVDDALRRDRRVLLVTQRDASLVRIVESDMYSVGVLAEIRQVISRQDVVRVVAIGLERVKITKFYAPVEEDNTCLHWRAAYEPMPLVSDETVSDVEMQAIINSVKDEFYVYSKMTQRFPAEFADTILKTNQPQTLFEGIWSNVELDYTDRQKLLEEDSLFLRLTMLYAALLRTNQVLQVEAELQSKVQMNMEQYQREAILREQMHCISEALGEGDSETGVYYERIQALKASDEVKVKLKKEVDRLAKMPQSSQEAYVITNYLDVVLDLPWGVYSKEKLDITKAAELLDKEHYGLKRVKARVLESMSVHALQPELTGQIICLVGPPGVGKTSIVRSVAKALGRSYVRVALGGVKDEAEIRGHRKTYVAAMPGRILEAMRQAKTMNPLILLDEIDKLSSDFKGDPASALLEALDSEQNSTFRDHFLELPFDLSRVMFITTANTTETIPAPLLDRMEIIELNSYTREEKFHIAREHLVKKQIKLNGLKGTQIRITDAAIYDLIDYYTKEAGVRTLERQIATLCRKCAKSLLTQLVKRVQYTPEVLERELGPHRYQRDFFSYADTVGLVNGLAWTSVGGVLMPLEVLLMDGKGEVKLTGSLGDVMKESAQLAISYARSVAKRYDILPEAFQKKDIHIHAPEGAVPKDGPSAGVTMTTALISAFSGRPVRHDIAMTGEITLHGNVLPIGGLVEKTMAAYKNGVYTLVIPTANEPELVELDETVRNAMRFVPVAHIEEVLELALVKPVIPEYDMRLEPLMEEETQTLAMPSKKRRDTTQPAQASVVTQ